MERWLQIVLRTVPVSMNCITVGEWKILKTAKLWVQMKLLKSQIAVIQQTEGTCCRGIPVGRIARFASHRVETLRNDFGYLRFGAEVFNRCSPNCRNRRLVMSMYSGLRSIPT